MAVDWILVAIYWQGCCLTDYCQISGRMAVDCKCWLSFTGWQFDPLLRDHRRGALRSFPDALSVHGTTAGNWLYAQAGPQCQCLWNCTVRKRVAGFLIFNLQSTPVKGYWGSERGGREGGWKRCREREGRSGERERERERERDVHTHARIHAPTYPQIQRWKPRWEWKRMTVRRETPRGSGADFTTDIV